MSWIKPNFLWMMYRCGRATKEGQERVLAVSLARAAFDQILLEAVPSTYSRDLYKDADDWRKEVQQSSVRLQWDPDHDPSGAPQARRAIQLGLRGVTLERYARQWLLEVEDVTAFVREQHQNVLAGRLDVLATPTKWVYPPPPDVSPRLGLTTGGRDG